MNLVTSLNADLVGRLSFVKYSQTIDSVGDLLDFIEPKPNQSMIVAFHTRISADISPTRTTVFLKGFYFAQNPRNGDYYTYGNIGDILALVMSGGLYIGNITINSGDNYKNAKLQWGTCQTNL